MKKNQILKLTGAFSIIGGIGLLLWWFLIPAFLPVSEAVEHFEKMILHNAWLPINLIGLIAILFITLGFPAFYFNNSENLDKQGFTGTILTIIGLILYTSIQYYETIIWPAAAKLYPSLLQVKGALVSGDRGVTIALLVSGIILAIGYIIFGISTLKSRKYKKLPLYLIIFGAPVFGLGISFILRTVGLIPFCIGTIWLGNMIRKENS